MNKTPKTGSTEGFSLMELLIAIGILSVISVSCYIAFDTGLKSWRKSEARVERYQNARAALDMMGRELQSAFILTGSGIYRLQGSATSLYFTTSAIRVTTDIYEVGYVRTSDNVLWRQIETPPDSSNATGSSSELAQSVTELEFWYGYYSNTARTTWAWGDTWDNSTDAKTNYDKSGNSKTPYDGLPEAIRIGLTVQDEKRYESAQSFYTIVYLPDAE